MFHRSVGFAAAALVSWILGLSPVQATEPAEALVRDLGTQSPGARLTTAIAAHNVNCKGRHDFELVVRDAPWLTWPGTRDLTGIRKGRTKSTSVVVDTTGLEPGTHQGRIEVRCLTCPAKCYQDRTALDLVVRIGGSRVADTADGPEVPDTLGELDPANPANPFDSYGRFHNAMLDHVAENRSAIETAGVVLPSRLAFYLAETACDQLEAPGEGCEESAFIQIASVLMVTELPTDQIMAAAGFLPEQKEDVHRIEQAIAGAFDESEPTASAAAAIVQIKMIEEGVLQRTGSIAPEDLLRPCPPGQPPPCHWICSPIKKDVCVPLPRDPKPKADLAVDQAILMASSTARYSLAYWHHEAQSNSGRWNFSDEAGPDEPRRRTKAEDEPDDKSKECRFWCKVGKIAWGDFKGALVGGAQGFVRGGLKTFTLDGAAVDAGIGAAVGGVGASVKAAI